jgi:hypothetical protein
VNEFSLDGAPNETNSRQSGVNPTIDELGETKFDVTGYEAAVGHTMGVSTTQTTKYGTNGLHGSIRETYTAKRWAAIGISSLWPVASTVRALVPSALPLRTNMAGPERI